jgi:hypothetical protein
MNTAKLFFFIVIVIVIIISAGECSKNDIVLPETSKAMQFSSSFWCESPSDKQMFIVPESAHR